MVVLGKSGSIQAKVVVFGQKWLYSGEIGSTRAKMVVLRQNWLYSVKVVDSKVFVFG